jgi:hypothetical protein
LVPAAEMILSVGDRVNMPFMVAVAARIAAARDDAYRAGAFWGALEASEEREPTPAWTRQRGQYDEAMSKIAGPEFDRGCRRGRTLTLVEALQALRAPVPD